MDIASARIDVSGWLLETGKIASQAPGREEVGESLRMAVSAGLAAEGHAIFPVLIHNFPGPLDLGVIPDFVDSIEVKSNEKTFGFDFGVTDK